MKYALNRSYCDQKKMPPSVNISKSRYIITSPKILPLVFAILLIGFFSVALSDSVSGSLPVLRYSAYASQTVLGSPNMTILPLSSHSTLLHWSRTVCIEWETMSAVVSPFAMIFCMVFWLFLRKSPSPTANISSRIIMSGSTMLAMENAIRDFMPDESVRKGLSSNSRISAKSIISSYLPLINSLE